MDALERSVGEIGEVRGWPSAGGTRFKYGGSEVIVGEFGAVCGVGAATWSPVQQRLSQCPSTPQKSPWDSLLCVCTPSLTPHHIHYPPQEHIALERGSKQAVGYHQDPSLPIPAYMGLSVFCL
jgi:hypothetical protein